MAATGAGAHDGRAEDSRETLTRHVVPRTGTVVTGLGLGTAQLGNLGRVTTDEEAHGAVARAWERGIRYLDTAPSYGLGLSERRLGALLAAYPREECTVSTKVGRRLVPSPERAHLRDDEGFDVPADTRREWDLTRDGIRRSIEESLERTGLDRIDIAYLHDPDHVGDEAVATALPALVELRDEGVLGAVGAGMNQSAMLARFVRETDVDVVMLAGRYTLLEQGALADLLPLAVERSVAVVAAAPYNSGILARPRPEPGAHHNYAPADAALVERAHAIADVCERHGVTLPDAALAFPAAHPAVVSVVVGARTAAQVDDAVDRFRTHVPADVWSELREAGLLDPSAPTPA